MELSILGMRFQCILDCMKQTPDTVESINLACVALHNLLRNRNPLIPRQAIDTEDGRHHLQPWEWRQVRELTDGDDRHGRNVVTDAGVRQRDYLKEYFNSPAGSVPWQNDKI